MIELLLFINIFDSHVAVNMYPNYDYYYYASCDKPNRQIHKSY